MTRHVFLLHGLGARPITLWPLERYLIWKGVKNTHRLWYPVDKMTFEETLEYVDKEMAKYADKEKDTIVLIGQSMGGLVSNNMWKKGWNIDSAVYIGAPLHGARLIEKIESSVPTCVRRCLHKSLYKQKPYDFLRSKQPDDIPPHNYHAITMSWPFTDFDGCVYKDEGMLEPEHHTHLRGADHRTIFANPRLWSTVLKVM